MQFSESNKITYNGKKYYLHLFFSAPGSRTIGIELKNIELFKLENLLNLFVVTADVILLDLAGYLDRFILRQDVECALIFHRIKEKHDGNANIELVDYEHYLNLRFLVNKVQILERDKADIKYKISLIHTNIVNLLQNVNITTYDELEHEKNIFTLIYNCFADAGLAFTTSTLENLRSSLTTSYISSANDNVITATNYLLEMLFYNFNVDDTLKFISYIPRLNKYEVIDLGDITTSKDVTICTLSMFNNNNEAITTEVPVLLATLVRVPILDLHKALVKHSYSNYDKNENSFTTNLITNRRLRNVANAHDVMIEDIHKKYNLNLAKADLNIRRYGSYWNNKYATYRNLTDAMIGQNALIVNVPGSILIRLGGRCNVVIDRKTPTNDEFDKANTKIDNERYRGFEGVWYIGKITTLIQPNNENKFSLNLTLFKNFLEIKGIN